MNTTNVFAFLDWDRRNLAANDTDADLDQERTLWRDAGVLPQEARLGAFVQHDKREDGRSVFSDEWYHLKAEDWYSCEVQYALTCIDSDTDSEAFFFRDCDDHPRTFHGTTFKSLISILKAGGLRAGPDGHTFNGRHYKGVFMSAHLGEAFQRADPKQGMDEKGVVHPCAMPCVLELRVSHLHLRRYHKTNKDLFVSPGAEGQVLRIIRIVRVHFNQRYVRNFSELDTAQAVDTMQSAVPNGLHALCCSGSPSFGTCGLLIPDRWWEQGWHKSQKGYKYCPQCAKPVTCDYPFIE